MSYTLYMKIITKPKEWGNLLGVIIPSEIVKRNKITTDTKIVVEIKIENQIKEIFEAAKDLQIDSQEAKNYLRKQERIAEKRKWGDRRLLS